eukprot:1086746-Lingulodinium_polyedra.AAC.1
MSPPAGDVSSMVIETANLRPNSSLKVCDRIALANRVKLASLRFNSMEGISGMAATARGRAGGDTSATGAAPSKTSAIA